MFPWVLDGFSQDNTCTHTDATGANEFDEVSAIYVWHRVNRLLVTGPAVEAVVKTALVHSDGFAVHHVVLFVAVETKSHLPMIVLRSAHVARFTVHDLAGATRQQRGPFVIPAVDCDLVHGLDWTVAGLTGNTCLNVTFMGEVYEVRQVVDLDPRDRLFVFPILADLANKRAFGGDFVMAPHALTHTGYAR